MITLLRSLKLWQMEENVYRNIKNAVLYLLSGNTAAIFAVLYTSLMALPVPFAPVQLLFINLLTDSLPAPCHWHGTGR